MWSSVGECWEWTEHVRYEEVFTNTVITRKRILTIKKEVVVICMTYHEDNEPGGFSSRMTY